MPELGPFQDTAKAADLHINERRTNAICGTPLAVRCHVVPFNCRKPCVFEVVFEPRCETGFFDHARSAQFKFAAGEVLFGGLAKWQSGRPLLLWRKLPAFCLLDGALLDA